MSKRIILPAAPEDPVFKTGESGGRSKESAFLGEAAVDEGDVVAADEEPPPRRPRDVAAAAAAAADASAAATAGGAAAP
jgi:hypothetical protein